MNNKEKKQSDLSVLLGYAGNYKGLTFLGLALSAVAMILGMVPYVLICLSFSRREPTGRYRRKYGEA